jgi:hypothetical protein
LTKELAESVTFSGLDRTGAIVLFKPKNSAVESIKPSPEPAAPNAERLINKASAITAKPTPANL